MTPHADGRSRQAHDATVPATSALAALYALALAVRLTALGRPSLWYDELLEVERATGPWHALVFGRPIDQDPPLLALALRGWIAVGRLLGWPWVGAEGGAAGGAPSTLASPPIPVAIVDGGWAEAWLRLPSALLGVAAVALTAVWATRWFGRRVGLMAALLLALSPLAIHHSQEVNQYAAMIAATPMLLLMHERVTSRGARRDWLAYAAVSTAALATHYGLVFPLLALGLDLAWRAGRPWRAGQSGRGRRVRREPRETRETAGDDERRFALAVAGYALWCAAVIALLFALGLGSRMTLPHVQPRLWGTHLSKELAYVGDVGWREIVVFFPFPFAGGPAVLVADILGVLALVGAWRLWRGAEPERGRLLVGGYVGGTLAMTYGTSVLGWYPLGYRYGLFNLVPYFVLLAAGFASVGGRPSPPDPLPQVWGRGRSRRRGERVSGRRGGDWVGIGIAAVVGAAFAAFWPNAPWTAANPNVHVPREDARDVLREVAAGWRAGDRLIVYDGAAPAVRFYWRGDPADVVTLPPFAAGDATSTARARDAVMAALDAARADGHVAGGAQTARSWIVLSHVDSGDEAWLASAVRARTSSAPIVIRGDGAAVWRVDAPEAP